ncbi:hypothetical protein HDU86_007892 [Geranomyces michiganensis]|nr:hypothetical protein HDU86_007892 [Geranomyces michiganensis]
MPMFCYAWRRRASLLLLGAATALCLVILTAPSGVHSLPVPEPAYVTATAPLLSSLLAPRAHGNGDSDKESDRADAAGLDGSDIEMDVESQSDGDSDFDPNAGKGPINDGTVYDDGIDRFLDPNMRNGPALKQYLSDASGRKYDKVGLEELKNKPGTIVAGPLVDGKLKEWVFSDISPASNQQYAEIEHLVEGQSVVALTNALAVFRKSLNKAKLADFKKMMRAEHTINMKITQAGRTDIKAITGTPEKLLGEALNGIGNFELLLKGLNGYKANFGGDYTGKEGISSPGANAPVAAGLREYLIEHEVKMTNAVNNIAAVFEKISEQIEANDDFGKPKGAFRTKLQSEIDRLKLIYDGNLSNDDNGHSLLTRVKNAAETLAADPTRKDMRGHLAEQVAGLDGKRAITTKPKPKKQLATPASSSQKAGCKTRGNSRRSIFVRLFDRVFVPRLVKRDSGCSDDALVNEFENAVDQFGNEFNSNGDPVNENGDLVDENNIAIDAYGNKLDENGDARDDQGRLVDDEGEVDPDQSPRKPNLRCSGSSARQCRNKQRNLRENRNFASKDAAREVENREAALYSENRGEVNADTASTLSRIKTITGDEKILPGGPQGFDVDNPKSVYAGAETLEDAWENVGESFETAIGSTKKRLLNRASISKTLRAWRRNITQRIQRETTQPRDQRDGMKVSEAERQASVFNSALDNFNAHEPSLPVLDLYEGNVNPVPIEAFPDTLGDSVRDSDETASRATLEALREFSDLTDGAILPNGAEGLTLTVDDTGAMDDAIDPSEGLVAGAGEGGSAPIANWDEAWARIATTVNDYIDANPDLSPAKIRALLRATKALKKASNFKTGNSKGADQARQVVWDKANEIVRRAVSGDLGKEKEVKKLYADAQKAPLPGGNKDGPTDGIKASHIAEDVGGSMAEAGDRVIGDQMATMIKTKLGVNARKLARSFKNVFKSIGTKLAKADKLTPEAKAQMQSNMAALKSFRDQQVNKVANTPESDRAGMLAECELTLDIHNAYNEVATDAILGNAQQVFDSSQGTVTEFTNADLPDSLATLADAIGAKRELKALTVMHGLDSDIAPNAGYDPVVTNSGQLPAIGGIGEYVRELTPKEIANVADGATVEDAWNAVALKSIGLSGIATDFLKHPTFSTMRNALRRSLRSLKKGLNMREKGQKALAPSDRKDLPAMRAEAMRANLKDVSAKMKSDLGVSGESSPLSSGSGPSSELTNEDLRSSDTVISVGIVEALSDLKIEGQSPPSGILPGGDIAPSDDPSATIDPPALFNGANTMADVLQGVNDEVSNQLSFGSSSMSQANKIKALRGLGKLARMAAVAKKDVVSGIGRESASALGGAIETLGNLERSAGGIAAGAERGSTATGIDLPAMAINPVASTSFDPSTPGKLSTLAQEHGGNKNSPRSWSARLKNIRSSALKSATGRTLKTGEGNSKGK